MMNVMFVISLNEQKTKQKKKKKKKKKKLKLINGNVQIKKWVAELVLFSCSQYSKGRPNIWKLS